jgi:nucleotide-binding universal stress UspA family protein
MFKTILVHIDGTAPATGTMQAAALLAREHGARLVGLAATGRPPTDFLGDGLTPGFTLPPIDYTPLRERAQEQLRNFDREAERLGVTVREARVADSSAELALLTQSRYCDLMIVGQGAMTSSNPFMATQLAGYLAVKGACPVLAIPHSGVQASLGRHIMIGWNGSREARRAIDAAMPMLVAAEQVQLVVFNPGNYGTAHGERPGSDIATMLARHGAKVEVVCQPTMDEPGQALQQLAATSGADLIVAGAFGHSRLQEWFMGGSTRSLLEHMVVPVLLAH